ncbi:hypothetical protein GN958_ATG05482 [Phytophthora infestans]|uniref:Transmembrane protein n=1 Tax=Phytophthora infestans TaxID=4787 RepID=A0A8S9UY81_PHYIN|nr:hypothetical protein GN958_ATG05482 [Phytophthora infestans]
MPGHRRHSMSSTDSNALLVLLAVAMVLLVAAIELIVAYDPAAGFLPLLPPSPFLAVFLFLPVVSLNPFIVNFMGTRAAHRFVACSDPTRDAILCQSPARPACAASTPAAWIQAGSPRSRHQARGQHAAGLSSWLHAHVTTKRLPKENRAFVEFRFRWRVDKPPIARIQSSAGCQRRGRDEL